MKESELFELFISKLNKKERAYSDLVRICP